MKEQTVIKPKYTIRKFEGDDSGSYAVFRKDDVKGIPRGRVIFEYQAKPVVCGCTKREAEYYKHTLENKEETK